MEKSRKEEIRLSDHFTYGKLLRFVLPSIIMMVFTSIYGVVDGLFVSNFAGKESFAAINLVMPFIMVLGGMGFMIGTGGTALVSKIMGQGDGERANRTFSMMIWVTVILVAVLTALGLVFMEPMARFLGADENTFDDCVCYGRIVVAFTVSFMLQNVFQSFLIAAEKPKLGLIITVAAGVTNMVLDALFIAVFRWGVAGAAVATGISQCIGGGVSLVYFLFPNRSRLRLTRTRLQLRPILQACGNGSSELMTNLSSSIVNSLFNVQLLRLAGEIGVAAYGAIMYVSFIFAAIFIGYSMGSAPLVSYHYGADNHIELKNLFKKSLTLIGIWALILFTLARLSATPLTTLFVGYDQTLLNLTRQGFILYGFVYLVNGFNIYGSSFFTALNNGPVSALISFLRTLVFQTLCVMVLPIFFGLTGVWLSVTIAEILTLCVTVFFFLTMRKKYHY